MPQRPEKLLNHVRDAIRFKHDGGLHPRPQPVASGRPQPFGFTNAPNSVTLPLSVRPR
jgi:hypothetical protein